MVLGHEAAGTVVEVGAGVATLKVGDRVCMEPGVPDANSKASRLGMYNVDPAVTFWATPPIHGVLTPFVVLMLWWGLRERPIHTTSGKGFQFSLKPFDRNFRVYLIALAIFTLGNATDAFLLLRAGELGVTPPMIPLLWGAFSLVKSVGSPVAGRAVDRFGPRPLIVCGWILYAVIYLAFAGATTAGEVWLFFLIYGLFHALTEPAERTLVANLVAADSKGLAFGWFNFSVGVAALPASLSFGWIYKDYGPDAAFVWSAVLAMAAVAVLSFVRNPKSTPATA
jgi:MFS-type transporter involved in bile tolerance (Atg22 family)